MKKTFALVLFMLSGMIMAQQAQERYSRAKIHYSNAADLQTMLNAGIAVDHGMHKAGHFIISEFSQSELDEAERLGYTVEVLIDDAKAYFLDNQNNPSRANTDCVSYGRNYETPENFHQGSMGGYFTYQELLNELDEMVALYPNLITAKSPISNFLTEGEPNNGTTPPIGGNPIQWVKISDDPNSSETEPQILYTAIHHAREPASLSQLVFYMWYLLENYGTDPEVTNIVDHTELYFVPVINPDGYLYNQFTDPNGGGFWRKNRKNGHGVDNNRNYDYYIGGNPANGVWGGQGTSTDPGSPVYHGEGPFSEVENQAMRWFVEQHEFVLSFNNHTSGELLLFPFGYTENMPTPDNDTYQGISDILVGKNDYANIMGSQLYPAAGNSDDFMYGTVGTHDKIFSFTPEIGQSFWPLPSLIEPISKEMAYLNITAAQMANDHARAKVNTPLYVGEDLNPQIEFELQKIGLSGPGDYLVTIEPISSNVVNAGPGVSFNQLQNLEQETNSIQIELDSNIQSGEVILFDIVVDNGVYQHRLTAEHYFGAPEVVVFDAGDSTTDQFEANDWEVTSEDYFSAPTSITDRAQFDYQNNLDKPIALSETIDLSTATAASVSFYAKWDLENNFDMVQFEVSSDGGDSWTPQCGQWTNTGSGMGVQPEQLPLYDGKQLEWVREQIDLTDYLGESIQVRFRIVTDNNVTADGFFFDDLTVYGDGAVLSTPSFSGARFSVAPNPVTDRLQISGPTGSWEYKLFTLDGRTLDRGQTQSGEQLDLSSYPTGLYLLELASDAGRQSFKIVKE